MNNCFNLQYLQEFRSGDLLTYFALLLAYVAYVWSINRDLDSWKSLFISLKNDLENQKSWLAGEYFEETYKDKNSFSPKKIIYPLSFESLPEIIRRGVAELPNVSDKFVKQISLFNERIIAFNSFLDQIKKINTASPIVTEKLIDKLNELNINESNVKFDELKNKISELKNNEEVLYLAENNRRLNRLVHVDIIGNKSKQDKLHYLYCEITKELDNVLNNFDKKRPFFVRYKWWFAAISMPLFILIEIYLK